MCPLSYDTIVREEALDDFEEVGINYRMLIFLHKFLLTGKI